MNSSRPLALTSPLDRQVVQRRSLRDGMVQVAGRCAVACEGVSVRLSGRTMDGASHTTGWRPARLDPATRKFSARLLTPAGGWYRLEVRALKAGQTVAALRVPHVGVGEVFVGAGQSNSTNCGGMGSKSPRDGRTRCASGLVSSFDGVRWRIAHDPQPGAHDAYVDGSFWPAFGDAMAARFRVPIGVAVTGHAGTSIRQWTRRDTLFPWTLARLRALGRDGFRALLWHQGETDADAGMSAEDYADGLADILAGWRTTLRRGFPCFVAQASYLPAPKPRTSPRIRAGQRRLCTRGLALAGPDTDRLVGDLRDFDGTGIHFSRKGLRVHGEAWAKKVGDWLDAALGEAR